VLLWVRVRTEGAASATMQVLSAFPVLSILASPLLASASAVLYESADSEARNFVTGVSCDPLCERLLLTFASSAVATVATDSGIFFLL